MGDHRRRLREKERQVGRSIRVDEQSSLHRLSWLLRKRCSADCPGGAMTVKELNLARVGGDPACGRARRPRSAGCSAGLSRVSRCRGAAGPRLPASRPRRRDGATRGRARRWRRRVTIERARELAATIPRRGGRWPDLREEIKALVTEREDGFAAHDPQTARHYGLRRDPPRHARAGRQSRTPSRWRADRPGSHGDRHLLLLQGRQRPQPVAREHGAVPRARGQARRRARPRLRGSGFALQAAYRQAGPACSGRRPRARGRRLSRRGTLRPPP